MKKYFITILFTILLLGCCPESREITARTFETVRVLDGDTFKINYDGELISVRIWGINAPEMRTPDGPASKQALIKLIEGKIIRIEFPTDKKRDNFGRLLCQIFIDEIDVGYYLIKHGYAIRYMDKNQYLQK